MEFAIVLLNLVSLLCFATTLLVLLARVTRRRLRLESWIFLSLICCIFVFVNVSNILEHLGITQVLDYYEDYAELLVPLLFIAFLNSARLHMDIDRRKQNEAQLDAMVRERDDLLREIHHRVKNNLQVVISIIDLQRRRSGIEPKTEQILMATESRVFSMAAVHEVIYRFQNHRSIPAEEYTRAIVNRVSRNDASGRSGAVRALLQIGPEVSLGLDKAVSFGLLLNELVSSVYRYAFAGRQSGELRLNLSSAGGWVTLEVNDDGEAIERSGEPDDDMALSQTLLTNLVKQLEGTMSVAYERGNRVVVRFPA